MSRKFNPLKSATLSRQDKEYARGFGDNFYYISNILKERTLKNGKVQLYVQWEGWPAEYNSWVYKETLMPVQQLMNTLINSQQGSNPEKQKQQITSSNLIENNSQESQINYKSKYKNTNIRKTTSRSMSKNQISLRSLESIQHKKSSIIQNIRQTTQIIHQFHQSKHKSNKNQSYKQNQQKKSQKSQHKKIKDKLQSIKKSKNQYQKNINKKKSKIQINADKNLRKSKQICDQFQIQSQDTNQNRFAIKKSSHINIQQKSNNLISNINNKQKDKKQSNLSKFKQKISNKSSGCNNELLINIGQDTSELLDISKISFQSQMSSIMGFSFFRKDNFSGNDDKRAKINIRPRDKFSLEKRFKINMNKELGQNKLNGQDEFSSGQKKQRKKMFSKDFQIFNNRNKQIKNQCPSENVNRKSQQQIFNKAKINNVNYQHIDKNPVNQLGKNKQDQSLIQQQQNLSLKNSIKSNQKSKKIKPKTINKTNLICQIQIADKLLNKKTELLDSSHINNQKQNISKLSSIKQISFQIQSSSIQKNNKKQQQGQIVLPMQLLLTKNGMNMKNKKQQQQIIDQNSEYNKVDQYQDQQKIGNQQKAQQQNLNTIKQNLYIKKQQNQQSLISQNQCTQIKSTIQNSITNKKLSNQNNDISSKQDIANHKSNSKATSYQKQLQQNNKNIEKNTPIHENSQHTQNSQRNNNIMQLYYRRKYPQIFEPSQDMKTVNQPKKITKQHKLTNQHKVKESYSTFQRRNLFKQNQVKIQESSSATAQQDEQQYQKPTQTSNKQKIKNITKRNNKIATKKSRKTNKANKTNKNQQKQTQFMQNNFNQLTHSKLMDQMMLQNENNIIFRSQISSYSDNQVQQQQKSIKNIRNNNSKFNIK